MLKQLDSLNCPVCGHQNVQTTVCPQCETDLTLLHTLNQIDATPPPSAPSFNPLSVLTSIALILLLGMGVGIAVNNLLFRSPVTITSSQSSTPAVKPSPSPTPVVNSSPPPTPIEKSGMEYEVLQTDNLSNIAQRFYGDQNQWTIIRDANPSLQGRENYIQLGEKLVIPLGPAKIVNLEQNNIQE